MNPLEQKILAQIKREGPVTFERFMDMALYDPEYGYYASVEKRIGREGDFYTSSHLHPAFGSMIARQIRQMWDIMGRPADFTAVEMGAGEGYLCRDILDFLHRPEGSSRKTNALRENLRYIIVERYPGQRERQKALLAGYPDAVIWAARLEDVGRLTGCVLSNELLDAFPVHLVRMEEGLKEVYVESREGRLKEIAGPLSTDVIADHFRDSGIALSAGQTAEVNLRMKDWLKEVDAVLSKGFIMTIDYGHPAAEYYSEDRDRGTLMCYYRHEVYENPLDHVGEQDITAHVDFSALRRWGEESGFTTIGYCSQGTFLLSLGIDSEIERLFRESKDYQFEVARIKRLILPQGLGESHKVMIQYKGPGAPSLLGFAIRNQLRML
jgi:SAM-dependent MidA family methyltransferase